ncbi:hypothetical protein CDD80_4445 [Ophiocordyceps camponoti-rufipedis]|uniref:Uncharacterized protein n=1 Tax=Ophiocordyceps camponoti-rufipedis TaxID=2004952 RepID=A0A2C5ZCF7_9HYPO|nr:hypothetical protein CDD80_4445 [Ophiocordyceps camponoti-rufipedis]
MNGYRTASFTHTYTHPHPPGERKRPTGFRRRSLCDGDATRNHQRTLSLTHSLSLSLSRGMACLGGTGPDGGQKEKSSLSISLVDFDERERRGEAERGRDLGGGHKETLQRLFPDATAHRLEEYRLGIPPSFPQVLSLRTPVISAESRTLARKEGTYIGVLAACALDRPLTLTSPLLSSPLFSSISSSISSYTDRPRHPPLLSSGPLQQPLLLSSSFLPRIDLSHHPPSPTSSHLTPNISGYTRSSARQRCITLASDARQCAPFTPASDPTPARRLAP